MNVIDKVRVIGRGNIVVVDNIKEYPLHINDKVRVRDLQFEIRGIEFSEYMRHGGLILRPNDKVEEIKINDKIEKVMSKMYLGIDNQDGFREGGNLAVKGGTKCGDLQAEYLKKNKGIYAIVGETVDWHPSTHCSFKENGGQWPNHCEQFTKDASIYQPLYDVLKTCPNFTVFTKGCDEAHEEYSVFKNEKSRERILKLVELYGIDEIHVGGIAYDYCVAETVKDGLRYLPNVKFVVFGNFCPAIADETAIEFTKFIENSERVCLMEG